MKERLAQIDCPKFPHVGSFVILAHDPDGDWRVTVVAQDIEHESTHSRWFTHPGRAYVAYALRCIREAKAWGYAPVDEDFELHCTHELRQ